MKRISVLALLLALGAIAVTVMAEQETQNVIEVDQLGENLFVLRGEGSGGNTAVFITTDGVVVVDSKNPGWGQSILDKIDELTNKPVTTLINTHSHHDHVSGNVAFVPHDGDQYNEWLAVVEIVAHEVTKTNMETMGAYSGRTEPPVNVFSDTHGLGLPTTTFSDQLILGSGTDRVELFHFGRGHTGGDAWVVFPSARTLHAGDMFAGKWLPFLDANNGGSGVDISESLQGAHDSITNVDTIITGHSTQMTWEDLDEYAAFNRDFLNVVKNGVENGQSVEEIAKAWTIPAGYTDYSTPQIPIGSVKVIADELKGNR